jgi:uncharacterized protein (DUF2384 family)
MSAQLAYIDVTDDQGEAGIRASGTVASDRVDDLERVRDSIRLYSLAGKSATARTSLPVKVLYEMLAAAGNLVDSLGRYVLTPSASWMPGATPIRGSYWLALQKNRLQPLDSRAADSLDSLIDVWSRNLGRDTVLVEVGTERAQVEELVRRLRSLKDAQPVSLDVPMAASEVDALPAETEAAARRRSELAANWLRPADVSTLMGSTATSNPSQQAMRLRKAGQLLGVWISSERGYRYPPFQFGADGRVRPEVAELLRLLPPGNGSGWSQIEWLYAPHPRLEGRRPVDLMADSPTRVMEVARKQFKGHPDAGW